MTSTFFKKSGSDKQPHFASDWEKPIWDRSDYDSHSRDFELLLIEYKKLRVDNSTLDSRSLYYKWLASKGAVKIVMEGQYPDILVRDMEGKYQMYSAMWSRFNEWLNFRETLEENYIQLREDAWREVGMAVKGIGSLT